MTETSEGSTMKRTHKLRLIIGFPMLSIVIASVWLYLVGRSAKADLESAKVAVVNLSPGDLTSQPKVVASTVREANLKVLSAQRKVSTGIWRLANHVPIVNRTAVALQVSTAEVAQITSAFASSVKPLDTYVPDKRRVIDPKLVRIVANTIQALNDPTQRTITALEKLNLDWVPGSVRDAVTQLDQTLVSALPYLEQGRPLIHAFPMLLGVDKPRTWLLVMNNGAESRATGGLPGGWGILRVSAGKLQLLKQESNNRINGLFLKSWQQYVSPDQSYLYGDALGYWADANLSPDIPTNAKLMRALVQQYSGDSVDGVMFINQHTLAALMTLTGEIKVGSRTLSADNVADYVMRGVYFEHTNDQAKDAALAEVTRQVFNALTEQHHDLFSIVKALAPVSTTGDLRVWASDKNVQQQLAESSLGGVMTDATNPTHIVAFNNGGGNKIDAYLSEHVTYTQGQCMSQSGYRQSTMSVDIVNTAPNKGLPAYTTGRLDQNNPNPTVQGSTRMVVYVHVPIGAVFASASVNGKPVDLVSSGMDTGRVVWMFLVDSESKTTKRLNIKFMETALSTTPTPNIYVPPMAHPVTIQVTKGSRCL